MSISSLVVVIADGDTDGDKMKKTHPAEIAIKQKRLHHKPLT